MEFSNSATRLIRTHESASGTKDSMGYFIDKLNWHKAVPCVFYYFHMERPAECHYLKWGQILYMAETLAGNGVILQFQQFLS